MNATPPAADWVLGLDGCPSGWVGVFLDLKGRADPKLQLFDHIARALDHPETPRVIGVDMPIGFAEQAVKGGRACEIEARKQLGPRKSSVFATPSRAALYAEDYPGALTANRAHGGPGLSKQCFNLFPKMREIDALMTPALEHRVYEVHPELAFAAMAGAPMPHPKRTHHGRAVRLEALAAAGFARALFQPHPYKRKDAAPDDVLDAAAVAWSAARIAHRTHTTLPQSPPRDATGLAMRIAF